MTDVAVLGLEIDDTDVTRSDANLRKFDSTAKKTATGVTRSAKTMGNELRRTATAARAVSGGFGGNGLRQASLQVSQMAQQFSATGNAVQSVAIQLPDLALGFGTVGIAAGVVAGALLPVAVNALSGRDAVGELGDAIDDLQEAATQYQGTVDRLNAANEKLEEGYDSATEALRDLLQLQANVDRVTATDALKASVDGIAASFGDLSAVSDEAFARIANGQDFLASGIREIQEATAAGNNQLAAELGQQIQELSRLPALISQVSQEYGVTREQAQALLVAVREFQTANGLELQAQAATELAQELFEATNGLQDADEETKELYQSLLDAGIAASDIAETDVGAGIREATGAAAALKAELAAALTLFNRVQAQESLEYSGRGGDPRQFTEDAVAAREGGESLESILGRASTREREAAAASRRSRSGGGRSGKSEAQREAERQRNEDMRAAERIMNDLMTAQDQYNDALDQANRLYNAGVLPLQAYNDHVAKLREELIDEQWQNSGLSLVVDDMTEALSTARSVEEMFYNIGDAFRNMVQRSAADLINSGLTDLMQQAFGFTSDGGGGLLGSLFGGVGATVGGGPATQAIAGMIPSFDGGGYTGYGARSGGLDGRGGFAAMLHPHETVIDHSRGGSSGNGTQRVELVISTDQGAVVQIVENTAGAMIVQNNKQLPSLMRQHEKRPHHR